MISIAMATYNGEKYIKEQVDSILRQTIKDFELVAVDDCSTDKTLEILKEYEKKDKRVRVYCNKDNLGFTKNFERAITLCCGESIALSDQDDVWEERHLELLYNLMYKDGKRVRYVVVGNAECVDSKLNSLGRCTHDNFNKEGLIDKLNKTPYAFFFSTIHGCITQGSAMMFHKEVIKYALPIPSEFKYHDYYLGFVGSALNVFNSINEGGGGSYTDYNNEVSATLLQCAF